MNQEIQFIGRPIRSLQTILRQVARCNPDIPRVIPDGIYGTNTVDTVTAFQKKFGLPPTGVTDYLTWTKLVQVYSQSIAPDCPPKNPPLQAEG